MGDKIESKKLALEAGVNVVPGFGSEAGEALVNHMDVDAIAFTGSTATGRRIMAGAARQAERAHPGARHGRLQRPAIAAQPDFDEELRRPMRFPSPDQADRDKNHVLGTATSA